MAEFGRLVTIAFIFVPLSFVSIGGGSGIFAEMQRQAVDVQGWMSNREFVDLFAISRAAPGPGSLVAALVGWRAAGVLGALVAALCLYVPSSLLLYAVGLWWHREGQQRLRRAITTGLRPVAIGLIFAGGARVLEADGGGLLQIGTAALVTAVMLRWSNPYLMLSVTAGLYAGLVWTGFA
jgi:chromate transporter